MNILRKIDGKVKDYLENLMSEAELRGHGFIELRHSKRGKGGERLMGVDEAKVIKTSSGGRDGFDMYTTRIITDGVLDFYPDNNGVRWGYILDSKKNREWAASQVACEKMTSTDQKLLNWAKMLRSTNKDDYVLNDKNIQNYLDNRRRRSEKVKEEPAAVPSGLIEMIAQLQAQVLALTAAKVEEPAKKAPAKTTTKK